MDTLKGLFWKPDPAEQMRKCNNLIRTNARQIDRHMIQLKQLEQKTKTLIIATSKRRAAQPAEIRLLARELVRIRQQSSRLATSKAQLESVGYQVKEAFSVRKLEGSIRASASVMKDVNTLVRLPELMGTMRELSQELMKAGIIEEMVGDALPQEQEEEEEEGEAEGEVDKVLAELVGDRFGKVGMVPTEEIAPEEDEVDHVTEEMRERLQALKS